MCAVRVRRGPVSNLTVLATVLALTAGALQNCFAVSPAAPVPAPQTPDSPPGPAADPAADSPAEILFARRIQPTLAARCLPCHGLGDEPPAGGLDMRSRSGMEQGGDSGQSLIGASPAASPLLLAVRRKSDTWSAMPPKEADRLSPTEIAWLEEWVAAGAIWPSADRVQQLQREHAEEWGVEDGVMVQTSGGLSAAWTQRRYSPDGLWAWQPVQRPATAATGSAAIDELLSRHQPAGLQTAPRATAETLIRRLHFDLTGLPPDPDQIAAFAAEFATTPEPAYQRLVEQLLASPHYGERMAQHWLDVVRYADSSGFANDYERGNAWRYRDYVVRAFNSDKPFDRFILEQLAGDELTPADADPAAAAENLIALGFLRMGPWELTGMEVELVARQRFLDDVTNSVGETFLAQPLQCARCHDHKFDPIPTRDYYAIQAAFATTQLCERPAAFLPEENTSGFDERRYLEQRAADHETALREIDRILLDNAEEWYLREGRDPGIWRAAVAAASQVSAGNRRLVSDVFSRARSQLLRQQVPESHFPPKLVGLTPDQLGLERVARKGLERLKWALDRYEPFALSVYSGRTPTLRSVNAPLRIPADNRSGGELQQTHILTGGDPFSPADRVDQGVLSALSIAHVSTPPPADAISGRRLALAKWIAAPDNSLTVRCIVNRVWMWHFDRPLVPGPNHFGSSGGRPEHPELLDWLAAEFVAGGWSVKHLARLILNSEAWRRSSGLAADGDSRDQRAARERAYAVFRQRRLSAEELRDAQLAASGELNRTLGGIPNRPEIPAAAALQPRQVMGTFAEAWTANPLPAQRHRRSLYALRLRGLAIPALEVFDAPATDLSCERRNVSTTAPQIFALFNSQNSASRALALAARVLQEHPADEHAAIQRCYLLLFGRGPESAELQACHEHWQRMLPPQQQLQFPRQTVPLEAVREAVEENTGERFVFRERLHPHVDFMPDLQPADCDARTRALADVCLVLMNSSEFLYVD